MKWFKKLRRQSALGLLESALSAVERHYVFPLDAYEDAFRCSCGQVFKSASGFARCPNAHE
jgi:hypothetical protein